MTAGTLVGRVQELGVGRRWSCWGQVGSYGILHVEMGALSAGCRVGWDVTGCLVWCGLAGSTRSRMGLACALQ